MLDEEDAMFFLYMPVLGTMPVRNKSESLLSDSLLKPH